MPRSPSAFGRVSTLLALERAIRDDVLNGAIAPGSQLREVELTTKYEVGRNSVRAALQALVHSGLLRHEPNRGVFVPTFDAVDVHELYDVRRAIEGEAVSVVIRSNLDLSRVEQALARLHDLDDASDWKTAVTADLRLHAELVAASLSARMVRIFDGILAEQHLLLTSVEPLYPDGSVLGPMHAGIFEALAAGDEHTAQGRMRAHLLESEREIEQALFSPS